MDVLKKAWNYFRPYKRIMILCYCLTVVVIFLNMVNPYVTKIIFDSVYKQGLGGMLLPLLGLMVGVTVLRHCIQYTKAYILEYKTLEVIVDIRGELLRKFFKLSFETFNKAKTGDLLTVLTVDAENVKNIFANTMPAIFESVFSFVVASVILFSLSPLLTVLCYLTLPLVFFATRSYARQVRPIYVDVRAQAARISTVAQENINGVRIVRAFAREEFEKQKLDVENKKFTHINMKLVKVWAKMFWKMALLGNFPYLITLGAGSILTAQGVISLGTLVAFTGYINYLMNPINLISNYISMMQNALVSGEKMFAFLEQEPSVQNPEKGYIPAGFKGDISYNNVSLVYDGNEILKDISLQIPFGSKVGVIGPTSSGKTSLVNLLPRFYDCTGGSLEIDGVDVRSYDLSFLRKQVSFVMQDVFLFSNTIDSNIAYNDSHIGEDKVVGAAKCACANGFIVKMPQGYDTIVGERGIGLSGGQKQRISMARAIIKPAPILVLDDSTSALDNETEQEILHNIKNLERNCTLFVIASRISSIKDADVILLLDHGRIAECGTHDELMALGGQYAQIYNEQYGDNIREFIDDGLAAPCPTI